MQNLYFLTTRIKKNGRQFDVTMGSYDGAEVCELVRIFHYFNFRNIIKEKISVYIVTTGKQYLKTKAASKWKKSKNFCKNV